MCFFKAHGAQQQQLSEVSAADLADSGNALQLAVGKVLGRIEQKFESESEAERPLDEWRSKGGIRVNKRIHAIGLALCLPILIMGTPAIANARSPGGGQPPSQPAAAQGRSAAEQVAALKRSLAQSQAALARCEWIETTVFSMRDQEKSRTMNRCYHGADGKVQKIPLTAHPGEHARRGIRGRIAAEKNEELTDYMKQAIALLHQYIPPEPDAIQRVKDAGNMSISIIEPDARVGLQFKSYLVPGDELGIEVTLPDDHLAAISVTTLLVQKSEDGEDSDPVSLHVQMGTLQDGTTYADESTMEAPAKHLKVVVTNSGHVSRIP